MQHQLNNFESLVISYIKDTMKVLVSYPSFDYIVLYKAFIKVILFNLARNLGYENLDKESLDHIEKEYYTNPTIELTLILQLVNSYELLCNAEKNNGEINE